MGEFCLFDKVVKLVDGGSVINGAYHIYFFYIYITNYWIFRGLWMTLMGLKDDIVNFLINFRILNFYYLFNFFYLGGDLNKISKLQEAAEHDDARSCALYYASYYASSFVLLAPAV